LKGSGFSYLKIKFPRDSDAVIKESHRINSKLELITFLTLLSELRVVETSIKNSFFKEINSNLKFADRSN
jgi:hypothetical protein